MNQPTNIPTSRASGNHTNNPATNNPQTYPNNPGNQEEQIFLDIRPTETPVTPIEHMQNHFFRSNTATEIPTDNVPLTFDFGQ